MVSFWPFGRGDPSSPASFEKELSALSAKITDTQAYLDILRSRGRRVRGLVTLYLMLAYLLYGIVALAVIGQQNMGPLEWTGLAGGPVVIYTTRQLVAAFFNWRIDSAAAKLQAQQEERAKTIQKLKDATKYNSTLELLEKYGGGEPKKAKQQQQQQQGEGHDGGGRPNSRQNKHRQHGRTGIVPPVTANIQRNDGSNRPTTPNNLEPTAEFAPNADFSPPQSAQGSMRGAPPGINPETLHPQSNMGHDPDLMPQQMHPSPQFTQYDAPSGPHWYDRFLDLLLGEDEMAPRNRIVLICSRCRLVNGQAPPGTKTLGDVGQWKCMGCGFVNGSEEEGRKILRELMLEKEAKGREVPGGSEGSSDLVEVEKVDEEDDEDEEEGGKKKKKRSAE
ncbi:Protein lunapark [Zalerion maritima]|uniref:Endoplasmic reticulum junction formation protein lunapark n=1 Tax=Zalerion maritima TaxID=339359 RepID=A0AAD5RWE0_9PEZI|nr:Protein lunapark [Zalerion maritima]